jgi:hypothetical protein
LAHIPQLPAARKRHGCRNCTPAPVTPAYSPLRLQRNLSAEHTNPHLFTCGEHRVSHSHHKRDRRTGNRAPQRTTCGAPRRTNVIPSAVLKCYAATTSRGARMLFQVLCSSVTLRPHRAVPRGTTIHWRGGASVCQIRGSNEETRVCLLLLPRSLVRCSGYVATCRRCLSRLIAIGALAAALLRR